MVHFIIAVPGVRCAPDRRSVADPGGNSYRRVEVINLILQESSVSKCVFLLKACGEGAVGSRGDLFSHFTMGKIQWSLSAHV